MDTISLIILLSVIIPVAVAIVICILMYHSHQCQNRKSHRPTNSMGRFRCPRGRIVRENYAIDVATVYRDQQQHRLRERLPISEQSPPSYTSSMYQTRRKQLPLFSPIRVIPTIHVTVPMNTPSPTYSTMPPTYSEIFLTPQTAMNG
ncbi:unnamed protein product [Adineta ricciae]|uniref:Uncharacterized protein n=1 Tax=Adineta ricciae TaxID=249248 RepID=A0A813ZV78_ADIRI|nr:unnamed protein product [Adineta ricciae]